MNEIRKKILFFSQKLQAQTDLPLWKLANEKVGYAAALGEKVEWGPRMRVLRKMMGMVYRIQGNDIIILILAIFKSISIWCRVHKKLFFTNRSKGIYNKIFAGFGASPEEYLFADYLKNSKDTILRINWSTHEGISKLGCPSLVSILGCVFQNALGYTSKVKKSVPEVSENALEFITIYALNLGTYAFYRSFWAKAKRMGVEEVIVLAIDIPAYACVDANINTIYKQHGLMPLSVPIPRLYRIEVLTSEEEAFLKTALKEVDIIKVTKRVAKKTPKNNILMILSLNYDYEERLLVAKSLIAWAESKGLQILIRPTPKVKKDELHALGQNLPNVLFDDIKHDFSQSLHKWQPKFVAAWTSTALATALEDGYLPITLYSPDVDDVWNNIVYPMKDRVLFWPRDECKVTQSLNSEQEYDSQIRELRKAQTNWALA